MRATLTFGCAFLLIAPINAMASTPSPCQVHLILFVPADVRPPTILDQDPGVSYSTAFHLKHAPPLREGRGPVADTATGPGSLGLVAR